MVWLRNTSSTSWKLRRRVNTIDLQHRAAEAAQRGPWYQPPPTYLNTLPWFEVVSFIFIAGWDLAFNAGAGAAAAYVGAILNGKEATPFVLQLGARVALTKAGIATFREIMDKAGESNKLMLALIFHPFVTTPLLTVQVTGIALGETPNELLIASLVASIPLFFEARRRFEQKLLADYLSHVGEMQVRESQEMQELPQNFELLEHTVEKRTVFTTSFSKMWLIITDAIGGIVFAKMAESQGMPISSISAAASAGAVFGAISFGTRLLDRAFTGWYISYGKKKLSCIFGSWERFEFQPVQLTEEEVEEIQRISADARVVLGEVSGRLLTKLLTFVQVFMAKTMAFVNNSGPYNPLGLLAKAFSSLFNDD